MNLLQKYFTIYHNNNSQYLALPSTKNPRVIISLNNRKLFEQSFHIHNTASRKNRFIKSLFKKSYPIPKLFKKNILYETNSLINIKNLSKEVFKTDGVIFSSFYIGTPSANQKLTMQIMDENAAVLGYIKIAESKESKNFVLNEYNSCNYLDKLAIEHFEYPQNVKLLERDNNLILIQTNISQNTKQCGYNLNEEILFSLHELANKTFVCEESAQYFESLVKKFKNKMVAEKISIGNYAKKIDTWKDQLINEKLPLIFSHGDFVPYNIRTKNNKLGIFDWEFSKNKRLAGYDIFHFIFQGQYQIFKKNPHLIIKNILNKDSTNYIFIKKYFDKLNISYKYIPKLFLLYLIDSFLFDVEIRKQDNILTNHFLQGIFNLLEMSNDD